MARRSWLEHAIGAAALTAGAVLLVQHASAQTCTITGPPEAGLTELGYRLGVDRPGAAYWLDCGYGTPAWDSNTTSIFCRYPANGNAAGKAYTWTAKAAASWDHSQVYCAETGTITVYDCTLTCSPTVPPKAEKNTPFTLQGGATMSHCRGDWLGDWKVFKGGVLWAQCPWETTCQVSLAPEGTYDWRFTAAASWGDHSPFTEGTCVSTGQVVVEAATTELKVGSITFKANTITHASGSNTYTLTGNVRANDVLMLPATAVFTGNPASGTGTLTVNGDLRVAASPRTLTILSTGGSATFTVNGNATPGRLVPPMEKAQAELGFQLDGVPLYFNASDISVGAAAVTLRPIMFVGRKGSLHLGALQLTISLVTGLRPGLIGREILDGTVQPGVELVAPLDLAYDADTDTLTGSVDVHFPRLDIEVNGTADDLRFTFAVESGCIDTLDAGDFAPEEWVLLRLGPSPRPLLGLSGAAIVDICDASSYAPLFFGELYFSSRSNDTMGSGDAAWIYDPPRSFRLLHGTPSVLARPIAPAGRATLLGGPTFDTLVATGRYDVSDDATGADLIQGALALGVMSSSLGESRWRGYGVLNGAFSPSATCYCPPDEGPECSIATTAFDALSAGAGSAFNVSFDVAAAGWADEIAGTAFFSARDFLPDLPNAGVFVRRDLDALGKTSVDCYLLGNMTERNTTTPQGAVALRAAVVERAATFTAYEEPAVFGCVGKTGTLPNLAVRTPGGETITEATVGRFPGAAYAADDATHAAAVTVRSAAPGTWTLAVGNLGETEVDCRILTPVPPPQVAFTRVEQDGSALSVDLSVSPAAASTKVSLFYSQLADGIPEGEIATDLPAGSGAASATWDTSSVPTGSYFVFARTDDGYNVPITTIREPAIDVVNGALLPPTGLAATRTGDTATLTWTASLSPGVAGYTVRYTDDPDAPGYPSSSAAPLASGATVGGLDPRKAYRFCVVGYAFDGALSPCSASVMLAPTVRIRRVVPH